jgi:hypothetical protein
MPRRKKPPGYERWTWAEIEAGRRFSKSEKRWKRFAKNSSWKQRSDGSYAAPAHTQPILFLIVLLMLLLAAVAPKGLEHANGEAAIACMLILFALIALMVLLALVGGNSSKRGP